MHAVHPSSCLGDPQTAWDYQYSILVGEVKLWDPLWPWAEAWTSFHMALVPDLHILQRSSARDFPDNAMSVS